MRKQRQLTVEDWTKVGEQAKRVREELFILHHLSAGNMPVDIVGYIVKSINCLDAFRSKAEDRMLKSGISEDLTIFYGRHN